MKKTVLGFCLCFAILTNGFSQNYILYGLTSAGGNGSKTAGGTLFGYNINTNTFTAYYDFTPSTQSEPVSSLIQATNGLLYGTTTSGVAGGTLFSYDRQTNILNPLITFIGPNGSYPLNKPMQARNGKLYGTTDGGGSFSNGLVYSYNIFTSTDSAVIEFTHSITGGSDIECNLVQDSTVGGNGLLYGIIEGIGITPGSIFSYNSSTGKDSILYSFFIDSVNFPEGSLMQASNGLLYGTCQSGGVGFTGGLFSYNTHIQNYTHLLDFDTAIYPPFSGVLLDGRNGLLYWLAYANGTGNPAYSRGSICCYNPKTNRDSLIYRFDSIHGKNPYGSLILDTINGLMYGMTEEGGKYNSGVLFSFNPISGAEIDLVDLDSITGFSPYGDLLLLPDTTSKTATENLYYQNQNISVYPNPFSNTTTIALNITGKYYLELDDVTGRKLKQIEFTGNTYTLSAEGLARGMYFVRVSGRSPAGNYDNCIGTTKIVVQ